MEHMTALAPKFHGTTILAVRQGGRVAVAGDGQVTMQNTVVKQRAKKVRKIYKDQIIVGFAGATADALHLFERIEGKLEQYNGHLIRAAVELAKEWRTDKYLRRLEAVLVAVDRDNLFLISGNGDVIEPDEGVLAIGSGGGFAQAAANALVRNTAMSAREIALEAMKIAANLCIYTNSEITVEELA